MSLTFSNFKQTIPAQILTRGREYWRKGQILDINYDDEEYVWEAEVEGTDRYEVRVEQQSNGSLICSCTCPYEFGDVCKHVAAVLYAIEEAYPDQLATKPRKSAAKRQTRHDKLRQQLEKVPRETLVAAVLELAQQDRELLNRLLIRFGGDTAKPTDFRRVVKDALRTGRGDYGYIDYVGAIRVGHKLDDLIAQAEQWRDTGEVDRAVTLLQAIIDETAPIIGESDDSNGELSGALMDALEALKACAPRLHESGRDALFMYFFERIRNLTFGGEDWDWEMVEAAAELVDSPSRRALFTSALDEIGARNQGHGFFTSYTLENIAQYKYDLILRFDGDAAALKFLEANVDHANIRMMLIERAIAEKQWEKAYELIQSGIRQSDQRGYTGLSSQYRALQVKMLQQSGNQRQLLPTARRLWLDSGDPETFNLLKDIVPKTEWSKFVDGLLTDLRQDAMRKAWLLANEGRWKELWTFSQSIQHADWLIESYRSALEEHFPSELSAYYEKRAVSMMAVANGRGHYQNVVEYLRRMKRMGQQQRAAEMVEQFKNQYPKRRAMFDELSKL